jgi:hypothetical protein
VAYGHALGLLLPGCQVIKGSWHNRYQSVIVLIATISVKKGIIKMRCVRSAGDTL